MSDIVGHVDARGRPIISLPMSDQDDQLLVVVDTGFNGTLLLHDGDVARRKSRTARLEETVQLADGERRTLLLGRSQIFWFGRNLDIEILISPPDMSRASRADEPVGLVGTALLSPHKLTVDFASRRVVISEHVE